MAETPRGAVPGQITTPNPLEIYWEKNRRSILGSVVLAAALVAGWYGFGAYQRKQTSQRWLGFSTATGLRTDFTSSDNEWDSLRTMQQGQGFGYWVMQTRSALVTSLPQRLRAMDNTELRQEVERKKGTDQEPYLMWVLANALRLSGDPAGAKELGQQMLTRFADHPLCKPVDWPPVYTPPEEDVAAEPAQPKKEAPPLKQPDRGSCVQLMIQSVERDQQFIASHPALFEAPKPDASPTVVLKIQTPDGERTVKIAFYGKDAPKTVEKFLSQVRATPPFYNDLHVHHIQRPRSGANASPDTASYLAVGNPATKEGDRAKWTVEQKPANPNDIEKNPLSIFAGMVGAPLVTGLGPDEKKSNSEIIRIYANDASLDRAENDVVIFGRVIDGMEVIRNIVQGSFNTQTESDAGRGVPRDSIKIVSATVEG